jgi:hypothetical protein
MMFLKYRCRLGCETLGREVAGSISRARFCRIPLGTGVPQPHRPGEDHHAVRRRRRGGAERGAAGEGGRGGGGQDRPGARGHHGGGGGRGLPRRFRAAGPGDHPDHRAGRLHPRGRGGQPHAGPGPPPGRIAARTRARLSGEPADPAAPRPGWCPCTTRTPGRPGRAGPASRPGPAAGPGSPATLTASWRTARCTTAARPARRCPPPRSDGSRPCRGGRRARPPPAAATARRPRTPVRPAPA